MEFDDGYEPPEGEELEPVDMDALAVSIAESVVADLRPTIEASAVAMIDGLRPMFITLADQLLAQMEAQANVLRALVDALAQAGADTTAAEIAAGPSAPVPSGCETSAQIR